MKLFLLCFIFCLVVNIPNLQAANITVASYLARRLVEIGSTTVFGVTGDYSYLFLHAVEANVNLTRIGNHNELEAAYAAWGYARTSPVQAPGVVSVTYTVGGYIALTGIVGADIDNVPVIFIAGTPPLTAWQNYDNFGVSAHHVAEGYTAERDVFSRFTEAQAIIRNAQRAPLQIDEVILAALAFRRPVYLDVWTDVWNQLVPEPTSKLNPATVVPFAVNQTVVNQAINLTVAHFRSAKFPAIWAGRELKTYGLQDLFERLVNVTNIPYFTNQAAKGIISEFNPHYVAASQVGSQIDFVLELGTVYGDAESRSPGIGSYSPNAFSIRARRNSVTTSSRVLYSGVPLKPFLEGLFAALNSTYVNPYYSTSQHFVYPGSTKDQDNTILTFVNHIKYQGLINSNNILIPDTTLLNSYIINNVAVGRDGYISDNGLLTIGWTGGASLGIKAALPNKRALVVVGDGAFQNLPTGLATAATYGHNSIVFLLHNNVYCIEQVIEDPTPYHNLTDPFFPENLISDWNYTHLAKAYGAKGHRVFTHGDLTTAIDKGLRHEGTTLIEVMLPIRDYPH